MAASAAVLLLAYACAPPPRTVADLSSPASSPSPTPTPAVPLAAAAGAFHAGEVGIAYAPVATTVTGGEAPYAWTVSSGALPGGLTLAADGVVSGSPTAAGTFAFTLRVADSGGSSASIPESITVAPPLGASLIPACAKYCNVELGCVNVCGAFGSQSGGVAPYSYALTGGTLPAGTSLSGLSLTGTFKGVSGWLQFTVQVSDALGVTASLSPKFWMYDHVSLAGGSCVGNYITGCTVDLPITGGVPGVGRTVQIVSIAPYRPGPNVPQCWPATPAPGVGTATLGAGFVTVTIPSRLLDGYGAVWTVTVTDQTFCAASTYCVSNQATVVIGVQCG